MSGWVMTGWPQVIVIAFGNIINGAGCVAAIFFGPHTHAHTQCTRTHTRMRARAHTHTHCHLPRMPPPTPPSATASCLGRRQRRPRPGSGGNRGLPPLFPSAATIAAWIYGVIGLSHMFEAKVRRPPPARALGLRPPRLPSLVAVGRFASARLSEAGVRGAGRGGSKGG